MSAVAASIAIAELDGASITGQNHKLPMPAITGSLLHGSEHGIGIQVEATIQWQCGQGEAEKSPALNSWRKLAICWSQSACVRHVIMTSDVADYISCCL